MLPAVPKLWSQTIETHRHEVRDAIMETTWRLASTEGPMSVTMSQVAQEVGIGRATLYKYFPDVETILHARHEQHVLEHLTRLRELRDQSDDPGERLAAVTHGYAQICHHRAQHGSVELSALTHQPERVRDAERELRTLFQDVLGDTTASGAVHPGVPADELAIYSIHALGAAAGLPNQDAVGRLVNVVLRSLRP